MKLSDERINDLSHKILEALKKWAAQIPDTSKALLGIKKGIREFGEILEKIDAHVRQKIASLKRNVPEGSREWDLLYRQYCGEELSKKGL